mgnify:CR=1 FL=1
MYVYIEFCAEAMVEMKKYIKPEIEIVEFDIEDRVTNNDIMYQPGSAGLPIVGNSDEVFYSIEAGEEGYLVNNY